MNVRYVSLDDFSFPFLRLPACFITDTFAYPNICDISKSKAVFQLINCSLFVLRNRLPVTLDAAIGW